MLISPGIESPADSIACIAPKALSSFPQKTAVGKRDDFRIFCKSGKEAVSALYELTDYLYTAHRLTLQMSKTKLQTIDAFLKRELVDPSEEDKKGEEKRLRETIERILAETGYSVEIEKLPENQIEVAAQLVLLPLKANPPSGLIVDLSRVNFFGSVFISFLLRCHLLIKKQGNELVLAGVSDRIRELLRLTSLDTLWALYGTRAEALAMLGGSD